MNLKPWIQVVEPHEDIRKGRFDESVFAADIGAVLADRGAIEYRDPELFFKKTYFTQEISALLSDILLRLSGKKGIEPVVQLQTPFGGGKTHTLLAIYHLIRHKGTAIKSKDIKEILSENKLAQIPDAKIAIIDGGAVNAGTIRKTVEGLEIKTLWGEIAYQVGGAEAYKIIEKDDKTRISPGSNKIALLIKEHGPIIILLDETLKYLTKASGVKVEESTLAAQTISFMQELTEAIANSEKSVLLASLASSSSDFSDENEERIFQRLSKVFGRVEAIKEPVKGEEIYEVIRKRLFENLGSENDAKEVTSAYWEFYQKNKEDFPRQVRELNYKKQMEKSYPFHPEFINTLREKWGTITQFQKTRGVLRLLALVVADLYKKKHAGALIQASNINLGNPEILSELLKYTGRQFEGVVASDISGSTAKAPQIDRELGSEYAKESITEGIATAIFMHSFSAKTENGAAENELRLSTLHPNMPVAIFADSLNRAKDRFYYLDERNHLCRFTDVINLNKKIVDKEDAIRPEDVKGYVQNKLWEMIGSKFIDKNRFPEEDTDIPDLPKPRLVILSLEHAKGKISWNETEKHIINLLNNYGSKHRRFKNVLIFLIPDEVLQDQLQKTVRKYQALIQIDEEYKTKKGLSDEQKKQLQFKIRNIENELPSIIASTYRHVVVANDKDKLKLFDMGTIVYSQTNPISNIVWQTLKEHEKLIEKLDPNLILSERWSLWPKSKNSINVKLLWEYFAQYTNLPILANETVLKSCITQGVSRGLFGYALGDGKKFEKPFFNKYIEEENIEISDTAWLIIPEIAIKLLPEEEQVSIKKISTSGATSIIIEKVKEPKKELGAKTVKELSFDASLDWQNWQNFFTYIISPLTEENSNIRIEIKFESKSEDGIQQDKIDAILESISQICKDLKIKKKD
jgi:hypothetical protein